jgi:hypothetical protein
MASGISITQRTYRNFAIGTVVVAVLVALFVGRVVPQPPPPRVDVAKATKPARAAHYNPWAFQGDEAQSDDQGESGFYAEEAPRQDSVLERYEVSTAVDGVTDNPITAALEGREMRESVSPETIREMIDQSRERSGEAGTSRSDEVDQ